MYKPPAFWEWIPKIKEQTGLRIVANGDIWSREDYLRCREITGCADFMLGRGALANPLIFRQIKGEALGADWIALRGFLPQFFDASALYRDQAFALWRTKQWLQQMSRGSGGAAAAFQSLKTLSSAPEFRKRLLEL
jgi:tRNA-dihydrouridine synthase C